MWFSPRTTKNFLRLVWFLAAIAAFAILRFFPIQVANYLVFAAGGAFIAFVLVWEIPAFYREVKEM